MLPSAVTELRCQVLAQLKYRYQVIPLPSFCNMQLVFGYGASSYCSSFLQVLTAWEIQHFSNSEGYFMTTGGLQYFSKNNNIQPSSKKTRIHPTTCTILSPMSVTHHTLEMRNQQSLPIKVWLPIHQHWFWVIMQLLSIFNHFFDKPPRL